LLRGLYLENSVRALRKEAKYEFKLESLKWGQQDLEREKNS
jgi:hypothetical protein